ncbi:MAG: hypothetical protein ACE5JH_09850 [Acidobacteriota bacterium]
MSADSRRQHGPHGTGGGPLTGRRELVPRDPLPAWKALLQALILLGIPLGLLLIARVILRTYFPELGY